MAKAFEIYHNVLLDNNYGFAYDSQTFENLDGAQQAAFEAIEEYYQKKDETYFDSESESETETKPNHVAELDNIRWLLLDHIDQMDQVIAKYEAMQTTSAIKRAALHALHASN
jgi:hypothetical protein